MKCQDNYNTVEDVEKDILKENSRLWIVEYNLLHGGKGCAVIKASNASEVCNILKHDGCYNGNPHSYLITRVEEIIPSIEPMLICEQSLESDTK